MGNVIPDATALGGRPDLMSSRSETPDRSGEIIAAAGEKLGASTARAGDRIQTAEDRADYAFLNVQAGIIETRTMREAEKIQNYNEMEPYFREKFAERMGELMSGANPRVRSSVEQLYLGRTEANAAAVGKAAFLKKTDHMVTQMGDDLLDLQGQIGLAQTAEERIKLAADGRLLIRNAHNAGYIEKSKEWELSGLFTLEIIENRLRSLKAGAERGAWLKTRTNFGDSPEMIKIQDKNEKNHPGAVNVYAHSLNHVDMGRALKTVNENGDEEISTFKGTIVNDERINGGRATLIPTMWYGEVLNGDDEREMNVIKDHAIKAQNSGILWPSADSVKEARQMEDEIHEGMVGHADLAKAHRGIIDLIPLAQYQKMLATNDIEGESDRVIDAGWGHAARIFAELKGQPWHVIRAANDKITDPAVQRASETRLRRLFSDIETEKTEVFEEYADLIKHGSVKVEGEEPMFPTSMNFVSSENRELLDSDQYDALKALMDSRDAPPTITNADSDEFLYLKYMVLMSDDEFMRAARDPRWLDTLGPSNRSDVEEKLVAIGMREEQDLTQGEKENLRFSMGSWDDSDPLNLEKNAALLLGYKTAKAAFKTANGHFPQNADQLEILDDLNVGWVLRSYTSGGDDEVIPRVDVTAQERADYANEWAGVIPHSRRADIKSALNILGEHNPPEWRMQKVYRDMLNHGGAGTQPKQAAEIQAAERMTFLLAKQASVAAAIGKVRYGPDTLKIGSVSLWSADDEAELQRMISIVGMPPNYKDDPRTGKEGWGALFLSDLGVKMGEEVP